MPGLLTRLDPRRAPPLVLALAPIVVLLVIVGLTAEPTRLIFASDLAVYRHYGLAVLGGSIPYLDVKIEYPPLALVPMSLPLLAPPAGGIDDVGYIWRFALIEGGLAAAVGWVLHLVTGRSRATLVAWAVLVGIAWPSIALRYDLWPVACALVAVLVVERRPGPSGVAIGLGTMLKLYPIALLPVLGALLLVRRDLAGAGRLVAGCLLVVGVVMAVMWLVAGPASLDWLVYQQERGLQIESLGAGLLLALHTSAGEPLPIANAFGSVQVQGAGADLLVAASPIVLAILMAVVYLAAAVRFRLDDRRLGHVSGASLALASAAAIAALLVGSKVLSVQYVIWLLPFAFLLTGRIRWLVAAITVLSTAVYTIDYPGLWHQSVPVIAALLLRNGLLVVLGGWLLVELATGRDDQPAGASSSKASR